MGVRGGREGSREKQQDVGGNGGRLLVGSGKK